MIPWHNNNLILLLLLWFWLGINSHIEKCLYWARSFSQAIRGTKEGTSANAMPEEALKSVVVSREVLVC